MANTPLIILAPTVQTDLVALSKTYSQIATKLINRQSISEVEWAEAINGTSKVIKGVRELVESQPQGKFAKAVDYSGSSFIDVSIKFRKIYETYQAANGMSSIPIADILGVAAGVSDIIGSRLLLSGAFASIGVGFKALSLSLGVAQIAFGDTTLGAYGFGVSPQVNTPYDVQRVDTFADGKTVLIVAKDNASGLLEYRRYYDGKLASTAYEMSIGMFSIVAPGGAASILGFNPNDPTALARNFGAQRTTTGSFKPVDFADDLNQYGGSETTVLSSSTLLSTGAVPSALLSFNNEFNAQPILIDNNLTVALAGRDLAGAFASYTRSEGFTIHLASGSQITVNAQGQIRESRFETISGVGNRLTFKEFDGSSTEQTAYLDGRVETVAKALNQALIGREIRYPTTDHKVEFYDSSNQLAGTKTTELFFDDQGTSRIDRLVLTSGQIQVSTFNADESLFRLEVTTPATSTQPFTREVTTPKSDGSSQIEAYDSSGSLATTTRRQFFDDPEGRSFLDEITNHQTGEVKLVATGTDNSPRELQLRPSASDAQLRDDLYAGSATFLNALRAKDKIGMLLAGGKMALDYAKYSGANTTAAHTFLGDVSGVVGVIGALQGLRSADPLTQLNAAGNLLRGANYFAARMGATTESVVNGYTEGAQVFLNADALHLLNQFGAVLSIANLANLGQMLENGQVGSAIGATVGAINGAAFLGGATTTITGTAVAGGGTVSAAGTGAFIPMDPATLVIFIVAMAVLDEIFSEDPPPPPPVGQATFRTLADGTLGYELAQTAHGGEAILAAKLDAIVAKLNAQLAYANGRPLTEAQSTLLELTPGQIAALGQRPVLSDRDALALVASRMPKITLQSWPAYDPDNGVNNFFFILDNQHPQTGQSFMSGIARQDLVRHFAESLVYPQAIVSGWEVQHMVAKFGATEANWKTEGQWASALSAVEVQRGVLAGHDGCHRRHHNRRLQGRCVVQRFGYEGDPVGRGRGTCRVYCTVSYY